MSAESPSNIPFTIIAGTEIQLTVTTEGNFMISSEDLPARILPVSEQTHPSTIAVQYLYKDPKNEKVQYYENAYLPFPEKYWPKLMDILEKLEKLKFDKKSTPSTRTRLLVLTDAQTSIFELERELPKDENKINPIIVGLKNAFYEYYNDGEFQVF